MTHHSVIDPLIPIQEKISSYSEEDVARFRADFVGKGFVRIPKFLPAALHQAITEECSEITLTSGRNKQLAMKSTDDTPRRMRTVGQKILKEKSYFIPKIYACDALRMFLTSITGETVHRAPWPPEEYVLSNLFRNGDTHGWHWDDYSFAFVLYLKAPKVSQGGFLQLCGGGSWDKQNPKVNETLLNGAIHTHRCEAADAYLLHAQKYLHRVTPITKGGERLIVNMTWANDQDLAANMTHETNDILFAN